MLYDAVPPQFLLTAEGSKWEARFYWGKHYHWVVDATGKRVREDEMVLRRMAQEWNSGAQFFYIIDAQLQDGRPMMIDASMFLYVRFINWAVRLYPETWMTHAHRWYNEVPRLVAAALYYAEQKQPDIARDLCLHAKAMLKLGMGQLSKQQTENQQTLITAVETLAA